jgi:signal transduction histidine kinase/ligand-binding sensor domain-containing protein/DNA-binding response OmpR family regulator
MKRVFFNLVFLLACALVCAQNTEYRFRTFSPRGGFYYDGVQGIVQDNDGFIWILLENDLQRFDGYEYKRYASFFQNPDMPSFHSMVKDRAGCLYVSTSSGLFRYDKLSDCFRKFANTTIASLEFDNQNNLWYTFGGELYRWNRNESNPDNPEKCLYEQKPIVGIRYFSAGNTALYFASNGSRVYCCNDNKQGEVEFFYRLPADYRIAGIRCVDEYLWVLTQKHGVLKINISSRKIEGQWQFRDKRDENVPVNTFYVDKNSRIWVGTQKGLFILNFSTGKYQLCLHSKYDVFSLPNNSVWTIVGDSHRNIWIGTFAGGLCYVNLDEELQFKTYTPYESQLNHNLVSSFAEDGDFLWIGTEGGGLNELNLQTGVFTHYKADDGANSLSYNNIKSLALDARKRLWISTYKGGLDCFDTKTKKFRHFLHDPGNRKSLYVDDLRKVILAGDSGLWVVYQINRAMVSFFSFKDETFTHYPLGDDRYIFDFDEDNYGDLWFVTDRRLYKMDRKTGAIEDLSSGKMETLNARSVCVDAANNVWIGTIGRGIVKYDPSAERFTSYVGLMNFNVHIVNSICSDFSGCLWLGTNNGLFRYSIGDNAYRRFDENDGLQGDVYSHLASMRGKEGKLYFGGTNGFTITDAQSIGSNKFEPKTVISDFYIDNKSAIPVHGAGSEIILNYHQINFGFKFSSDNYLLPNKNRFKYRLRGYDDNWITTDAFNRTVMYSKIPSGTYYFEVLAANNDGVWSKRPTVIKIKRTPAPWENKWAYLLYFLVVLGIIALGLYYYHGQRKLKLQVYMDSLNEQKKEELHQSRLRFFTNISHDFRTPLSLILAALDNMKQEGMKEYYYQILNNNTQRLLNLVNELMDFKTIENGKMRLQVRLLDVNRLVTDLSYDFRDYARKRGIKFSVLCDPALPSALYVDKQVVEKVVMNLLNNSFKYTKDGGEITIATCSHVSGFSSKYGYSYSVWENQPPKTGFLIVVSDTGVGISKDSIHTVFDRYYQVSTQNLSLHLGTGIGLALVKSLVLLHKGGLSIFSESNKGTDIVACFPADASVYDKSEFVASDGQEENQPADYGLADENMHITDEDLFRDDRKKILLVEDNRDLRTLLSGFLAPHYEIIEAANGEEASKILETTDVHLILSDIMMPLKDGITLCREVKSDVNTSHIPFILLTAKTGKESHMEGVGSGADIYFEKPVDCNLLLLSVKNIFDRQQKLRDYYAKNYYADSAELSANERDNAFLKKVIGIIDANLSRADIDISYISSELSMSQNKFYSKLKMLTGKSAVQFVLNYKLRRAARIMIEQDLSMSQIMDQIGIRSLSYFTSAFKKEFGETPTSFVAKHKKRK